MTLATIDAAATDQPGGCLVHRQSRKYVRALQPGSISGSVSTECEGTGQRRKRLPDIRRDFRVDVERPLEGLWLLADCMLL